MKVETKRIKENPDNKTIEAETFDLGDDEDED